MPRGSGSPAVSMAPELVTGASVEVDVFPIGNARSSSQAEKWGYLVISTTAAQRWRAGPMRESLGRIAPSRMTGPLVQH